MHAIQGYEPSLLLKHQGSLFILMLFNFVRLVFHFPSVFYLLPLLVIRKQIMYICNSLLQYIILRFYLKSGSCNSPAVFLFLFLLFILILTLHPKPLLILLILNCSHSHINCFSCTRVSVTWCLQWAGIYNIKSEENPVWLMHTHYRNLFACFAILWKIQFYS